MHINMNVPQSLMQYKGYSQSSLTGENTFIFEFDNYDEKLYNLRVIQNSIILDSNSYKINITEKNIIVILNNYANAGDIIHLDVFIPLKRYNEYSICLYDYVIPCEESVNTYKLDFEYYNPITCKLQIFHSRLGFISKKDYKIDDNTIFFNNISFLDNDLLYIKLIQDGAILLQ